MARWDGGYPQYVTVADRKKQAEKLVQKLQKKGKIISPVIIEGRDIASSFWGKSWCQNLAKYSDYENRLPRGRSYAKNGSIIDLQVSSGVVEAQVNGSSLYDIKIKITPVVGKKWRDLCSQSAKSIGSVIELLQGKFSKAMMELFCDKNQGLFPTPKEIKMSCSCPDYAGMCKHIAATMYGIGARLDEKPEILFKLRGVDAIELIGAASASINTDKKSSKSKRIIEADDLSAVFGIDLGEEVVDVREVKPAKKKVIKKKTIKKSTA